jgi:hypothetical protein
MDESVIERMVTHAVRNTPELAIKEMLRLIRREAELEQELAKLKEKYGVLP